MQVSLYSTAIEHLEIIIDLHWLPVHAQIVCDAKGSRHILYTYHKTACLGLGVPIQAWYCAFGVLWCSSH